MSKIQWNTSNKLLDKIIEQTLVFTLEFADGTWQWIHSEFVKKIPPGGEPQQMGRNPTPTAGCIDSQSVKTTANGGRHRGFDAGKLIKGRKRRRAAPFILTDTQGLLLAVWVCAASVSEKAGSMQLLRYIKRVSCLKALCETMQLVWVDGGYRGEDLLNYVNKLWGWVWQVVLRSEEAKGFQPPGGPVLPRRWVVERTFAWLLQTRRLNRGGGPQRLRKKPTKQPKHGLSGNDFSDAQPPKLGFKTVSKINRCTPLGKSLEIPGVEHLPREKCNPTVWS